MAERDSMTAERWRILKEILADAREQPLAGREAWLRRACGGDAELVREVESFLVHEQRLTGFIDEPVVDWSHGGVDEEPGESGSAVGRRVGPYRLLRLLGEGGMGAVYLAEREQDFEQRVALKLVRHTAASPEMLRRFEAERQILARLEHPNIARLLDGGTTDDGIPYFAMEVVEGEPIDRWCDRHRLPTRRRVELFLEVCSALELAHQNLVIHRDLKPGNILVDASGTPKLLDFGIAKLLSEDDDPAAPRTRGQAMTPRYASPEQLQGEAVGTASDVYSLAVVLYRVLTGHLPKGLESSSPMAVMKAVCEEEPLAPSVVVGQRGEPSDDGPGKTGPTPETISQTRDGDPRTLRRRLEGDLDAILAKALRKEPRRRYPSVGRLADDLRRHLDGLPVTARQGSMAYTAGKWIRRHRLAMASLLTIVALVAFFTTALVQQLSRSERSRERSEEISSFLIELFQSAAPDRLAGDEPTVRDLLDRGRAKLDSGLEQSPEVRATLLFKLGEVYLELGDYHQAEGLLDEAIVLLRRLHGGDHPDLATAIGDLAALHYKTGDLEAAEARFRDSLAMRRRLGRDEDLIKPSNNLATVLMARGKTREAQAIYQDNLARRRAAVAASPDDPRALSNLATNLYSLGMARLLGAEGEPDALLAAESLWLEALELRRRLYGSESPKVATVILALGRLDHRRGRLAEAEARLVEALEIRRRELGDDHVDTALAKKGLAALLLERGDTEPAGKLLREALSTLRAVRSSDDDDILEIETALAAIDAQETAVNR